MKKKTITGIVLLMSLSLFGIIGLQAYWLNHAMQVREADFDRKVNEALAATAEKLEARETAQLVAQGMQLVSAQDSVTVTQEIAVVNSPARAKNQKPAGKKKPATVTPANPPKKANTPAQWHLVADTFLVKPRLVNAAEVLAFNQELQARKPFPDSLLPHNVQKIVYLKEPGEKVLVEMIRNNRVLFPPNSAGFTDSVLTKVKKFQLADAEQMRIEHKPGNGVTTNSAAENMRFRIGEKIKIDTLALTENQTEWRGARFGAKPDSLSSFRIFFHDSKEPASSETPKVGRFTRVNQRRKKSESTLEAEATQKTIPVSEIAPEEVQQRQFVAKQGHQLHSVMERMLVEMLRKNTPVEERISNQELDSVLQAELSKRQVMLPYRFFVLNNQQHPVMKLASAGYSVTGPEPQNAQYIAQLFPNALSGSRNFLLVNFTGRGGYVWQSMQPVFLLSGLFTLIILFTFSSTLFYIFRQKKLSDIKTDFINNMTHEFKTPIATIGLAVQNINNPRVAADPERVRQYTGIISQENARMNEHVERVLQAALLDRKLEIQQAEVAMHALIQQATNALRLQVESRGGNIALDLAAENDRVLGDAEHLLHVLLNLLDNANKYSPESPEITVSTRSAAGKFYVTVTDKGQGMSRDVQKRIFEKFYRKPTGNVHNVKGFGLGLSYLKAITEAHKGTVSVRSHEGKGAAFTLTFTSLPKGYA